MTERLTTEQAAAVAGMTRSAFRGAASRLRRREHGPIDLRLPADMWPDARTPLYDGTAVRAWVAARTRTRKDTL